MTATPLNLVSSLIDLLEQQLAILRQLSDQVEIQTAAVADGETESLLGVLAQRQQVIDRLEKINGDLSPFRNNWDQIWAGLDEAEQTQVSPLVQEVHQLLDQVLAADEKDRKKLEAAKNQVAADLVRLAQSGEATAAYKGAGATDHQNRFTNKQG